MVLAVAVSLLLLGCGQEKEVSSFHPVNWEKRRARFNEGSVFVRGSSYLSVYSEIYSETEHKTHNLAVTVSMRNTNLKDTVYIDRAVYYNTQGEAIRSYFSHPIYVAPLETVEIVIDESDRTGGSGANFVFDWRMAPRLHEPFFEGVMISTLGQQGLSFTTQGRRVD